jgi:hypothetical protein
MEPPVFSGYSPSPRASGRNQKKYFRGKRGPSPPNFCNDSTEKGAMVLSPPNIWSRDRQQSRIGERRQTPVQKIAKSAQDAQENKLRMRSCMQQDAQDGRRMPAHAGARWRKKLLNRRYVSSRDQIGGEAPSPPF